MLFSIPGAGIEPGYLNLYPVKLGVKVRTLSTGLAKTGVGVNGIEQKTARHGVSVRQKTFYSARHSVTVATMKRAPVKSGVFIRSGEGFMLLADIYPDSIAATLGSGGTYPVQFVRPRLTINGVEIPIIDFDYQRPEGRLGSLLNVTTALFDINTLTPMMPVNFGYMIYNPTTMTEHYEPRMTNGKLMGFQLNIGFQESGQRRGAADSVSISAVDIVGDRFNLRPLRPVTLYDPGKTNTAEVTHFDTESALRVLTGALIRPSFVRVPGLGSGNALFEAYVYGLGFNSVVSNIPNYAITRADFTIEGGWHNGALPLFAMYGPLFFDSFNTLFILNITWALPTGFTPRVIHNADYQKLNLISPVKDYTNSLILSYKATAAEVAAEDGMYFSYRFEQDTQTQGEYGSPGYQRTETTRKIRELRNSVDPENVISEWEEQSIVEVFAQVSPGKESGGNWIFVGSTSGEAQLVHRDTQDNIYDGNGLKTSHKKTVEAAILDWTDGSVNLKTVLEENVSIEWVTSDDPNLMVQARSVTRIEGLVAQSVSSRELPGAGGATTTVVTLHPVLAAQFNGIPVEDAVDGVFNPWVKIRTITETLRHTKGNQLDVEVLDFDNLTGTSRVTITQPRTGTPLTSLYAGKVRHILLEDEASIAEIGPRIPVGINAGELPRDRSIALGFDVLRYIKNPRYEADVILAGLDLTLDRGSVIVPRKRTEDASHFIVTGTTEKGTPKFDGAGRLKGFEIVMTLKGQQVNS